jgi:tetratricopeptide (TPR) repeat protein
MTVYISTLRLLCASLAISLSLIAYKVVPAQETKLTFERLVKDQANAEIIKLWTEHPYDTLPTIDSYLEGSLKIIETTPQLDPVAIRDMHANAMAGAQAADEAFGTIIFSEYASSFIGWNRNQQRQFRAGQKAHGDAKTAMQAKRFDAALTAAQECIDKAQPLGDWWGMAMGYSAVGTAQNALGNQEEALTAFTLSRSIYHDLRLGRAELNCVLEMAGLLKQAKSLARTKITCRQGMTLAEKLGDNAAKAKLSQILSQLE